MRNGEISYWFRDTRPKNRGRLNDDLSADICIVGGGFTGLWAAWHAAQQDPSAKIVVLEKHHVGFGASGRNAGWLSPLVPGNRAVYVKSSGSKEAALRLQRRMLSAVDEVLDVMQENNVEAAAKKSGNVVVARTPAAMRRLEERRTGDLRWGYTEDEVQWLSAQELNERIMVNGARGGLFYPTVGRVDPGQMVQSLADLCERQGVTILEDTEVTSIQSGVVTTLRGQVIAPKILRATEGYSSTLAEDPRKIIPINSSIIITEPLADDVWANIGWKNYELLSDNAHVFSYLQKTDDGRILLGGRGKPYRYGSNILLDGSTDLGTVQTLVERLHDMFPATRGSAIDHTWSGVLGVTRDWCATVEYDSVSGLGAAQGYAGHGVTSAYLAAKSLVDLSYDNNTDDATLPWVSHRARSWEPEPIRWTGVHAMYSLFGVADQQEEKTNAQSTSLLARIGGKIAGLAD